MSIRSNFDTYLTLIHTPELKRVRENEEEGEVQPLKKVKVSKGNSNFNSKLSEIDSEINNISVSFEELYKKEEELKKAKEELKKDKISLINKEKNRLLDIVELINNYRADDAIELNHLKNDYENSLKQKETTIKEQEYAYQRMEDKYRNCKQRLLDLIQENKKLKDQNRTLCLENGAAALDYQNTLGEYKESLDNREGRIKTLEGRIKELEKNQILLQQEVNLYKISYPELKEKCRQLEENNCYLLKNISEQEKLQKYQILEKNLKIKSIEDKLQNYENNENVITLLKQTNNKIKEKKDNLEKENVEIKRENAEIKKEIDNLKKEKSEKEESLLTIKDKIEILLNRK